MAVVFLDPTAEAEVESQHLSDLPATLVGATVGLLDNSKDNADIVLEAVGKQLQDAEAVTVRPVRKRLPSTGADPDALDELAASCDLVIGGVGDCGSCTTWSCHDVVELERRGTPAVLVCSETFAGLAMAVGASLGARSLRLAVVPHPVGGLDRASLQDRGVFAAAVKGVVEAINGKVVLTEAAQDEVAAR